MRTAIILAAAVLLAAAPMTPAAAGDIQPGMQIQTGGSLCTLNFIYDGTGAQAGEVYGGTAAHCVGHVGQAVTGTGVGRIGDVAYRGDLEGIDDTYDFAFIKIDDDKHHLVNPEVKGHPGFPTGIIDHGDTATGDLVLFSGYGTGYGLTQQTREERVGVLAADNADTWWSYGWATPGDSGGPLLHESGAALGIVTHLTAASFSCCGDDLHATTGSDGPTLPGLLSRAAADGFTVDLRTV